jgi:hypothetical protein
MQFLLVDGRVVSGVVLEETAAGLRVAPSLLTPADTLTLRRTDIEERIPVRVSAMPAGLLNVLTRDEVLALV